MSWRRGSLTLVEARDWRREVAGCLSLAPRPVHFVGVGNPLRGDDGVGVEVASILRRALRSSRRVAEVHPPASSPERELSRVPPSHGLVIFDAVESGGEPGQIVCASLGSTQFGFFATHNVPLRIIPGVAERMDRVFVIGVEPEAMEVGEGLSPRVSAAARELAEEVVRQVGSHG